MIKLTRFDGNEIVVNAELIETIETTPDTVVSPTTKNKILVKENMNEIVEKIIAYKRMIHTVYEKQEGQSDN